MYERFTDRARKVMKLANEEAQRFNHEYIGTEHLLLALVKEGSGTAAAVLKNLDIDLGKIRLEVEKLIPSGPDMAAIGRLPQAPRAKKVVEYAMEEARFLNHNYVGTEHFLLGLLREEEGVAAHVLMNLGLTLEQVRQEVLNLLGRGLAPAAAEDADHEIGEAARRRNREGRGMYDRFTDRTRKVMELANQEAQRFNHEHLGTEHILLGLVKEGSGVAANVLKNLDIDLRKIRLEVEKVIQSGPDMLMAGKLPLTPRAKKAINYALEEARNLNHNYVGTEHLLLGMLREKEGVAARVLIGLGLTLVEVRHEVLNLLGHVAEPAAEAAGGVAEPAAGEATRVESAILRSMPLTARAQKVFQLANETAQRLDSRTVEPEHVLLGLLDEGSGAALRVLKQLGIDLRKLRLEFEKIVQSEAGQEPSDPASRELGTKKTLGRAIHEAMELGHPFIGTEHILLGLLSEPDDVARRALSNVGLTLEELRPAVARVQKGDFAATVDRLTVPERVQPWSTTGRYAQFTDRARDVLRSANDEAARFNHEYIGTEHILLGLIEEGTDWYSTNGAGRVLVNLGIDPRKVRREVEKLIQYGPDAATVGRLPQTPRAKQVVNYAIEEAHWLEHKHVEPEHLLLGLVRECEGVAAQVLINLGLKLDAARAEVRKLIGGGSESAG
ncbi:MAG TPA: Clp protease N-terminal domain-containing protein [Pirellulales bacterium]|nr:Clp protease N-terminal domain-containing protein [Pirellulales bacterium]